MASGFDTYDFVESLRKTGFKKDQAAEIAKGIKKLSEDHLATKTDLKELKYDIYKTLLPLILGQYALLFGLFFR